MIRIYNIKDVSDQDIFLRQTGVKDVSDPVSQIIRRVREEGDAALLDYARQFDGVELDSLTVTQAELDQALASEDPAFVAVLREAADNIRSYHAKQKRQSFIMEEKDGVILGQKIMPLARVGIYVPGGTAAYPSTVLMNAIPAHIAGVEEIIMVTPPGKDGKVNPAILAAAHIAGVTRIFKVGGAQAIAALAYGTESIPQVDKIVGPGNAYVAEAKKQVFGQVNIDMIAGPSEVLVIADGKSDPAFVAADLLSQAEHDKMASAVLVTESKELAQAVAEEIEGQLEQLERRDIARASIDQNGRILLVEDLAEGIDVANRMARIANISLQALGQVIFSASGGGAKSAEEIFRTDYKEFHIAGHNLAVSQVTCMDSDQLLQRKGEFLQLMSSLQKKQGFDMVILMITDVLLEGTQLLFVGDRDSIRQAFNVEDAEDVVFLPKVMSRKKQVIPMLSALWG